MIQNFQIDVTNVVNKVKAHNLLFYPVIIYIFSKTFYKCGFNKIKPAYINTDENGEFAILSQEYTDCFETFFNDYVKNCFYNQKTNTQLKNCIIFSYIPQNKLNISDNAIPVLYINPLIYDGEQIYLSFCIKNFSCNEEFVSLFQDFCNLFCFS